MSAITKRQIKEIRLSLDKPMARLGGIYGVILQEHIDLIVPEARKIYTTPLFAVDRDLILALVREIEEMRERH